MVEDEDGLVSRMLGFLQFYQMEDSMGGQTDQNLGILSRPEQGTILGMRSFQPVPLQDWQTLARGQVTSASPEERRICVCVCGG